MCDDLRANNDARLAHDKKTQACSAWALSCVQFRWIESDERNQKNEQTYSATPCSTEISKCDFAGTSNDVPAP